MDVHNTALIAEGAQIGPNVTVGPYAVIGKATIGADCVIHAHAVIGDGVTLGDAVEVFPGALIGREPKAAGATSRPISYEPAIDIESSCSIGPHAVIYYDVRIGAGTLIGDGASIREQCRIGTSAIISRYVTLNYNVRIGDRVKVMDGTHLTGNMVIEDDAFVSCLVASMNDNSIRAGFGDHIVGPTVGKEATVGGGAILNPAITVGEKAFVGSGALVTKDVPAGEIWTGVPAKPR